jgi:membrane protease YdiL (CAAX protease family)
LVREMSRPIPWREVFSIAVLFVVIGGSIAVWVRQEMPDVFLSMPQGNPSLWRLVMVFYPLLSVIPQELVYRTFFFHRYGPLFGRFTWAAILLNGALFGFAHIIFGSWTSVLLSGALGCLLAYRYVVTRSFWAVWLEHALYGDLIFTIGLGRYFFTGVSSVVVR